MSNKPACYDEWLAFVFEHPNDRDWYFDDHYNADFEASSQALVDLITYTCLHCGQDLLCYSEAEVRDGLSYIFNNSCSDTIFCFKDDQVSLDARLNGIRSIKVLYKDCFAPRCAPALSSLDEPGVNRLNNICYMLWDVTPLGYWQQHPHRILFYEAVVDVLEYALTLSNVACIESALHGLGHLRLYHPARISVIMDRFLRDFQHDIPKLRSYAEAAARGAIL